MSNDSSDMASTQEQPQLQGEAAEPASPTAEEILRHQRRQMMIRTAMLAAPLLLTLRARPVHAGNQKNNSKDKDKGWSKDKDKDKNNTNSNSLGLEYGEYNSPDGEIHEPSKSKKKKKKNKGKYDW